MDDRQYYVYVLANATNTCTYVGVTNDLVRRVFEHKGKFVAGYTSRYHIDKLVYYEVTGDIVSAISREKQLKSYSRARKVSLVSSMNPAWEDLYEQL